MTSTRKHWATAVSVGLAAVTLASVATAGGDAVGRKTLTYVQGSSPVALDPAVVSDAQSGKIIHNIYDRLLDVTPDGKSFRPNLATSWTVSEDGRTYTFKLRPNVRFTDRTPFTAEAVRFSIRRTLAIGKGDSSLLARYVSRSGVTVVSPTTVRIRLKEPYPNILYLLGYFSTGSIINPSFVKKNATTKDPWAEKYLAGRANGTGPFTLVSWRRNQFVELKRNDSYWRGPAKVNRVVIRFSAEPNSTRLALERGDVDIVETLPTDVITALRNARNVRIATYPTLTTDFWVFNNASGPLSNPKVRLALSYAVDYQGIMGSIVGDGGRQMRGPLPSAVSSFNASIQPLKRNVSRAKALLAEAGYSNGFELKSNSLDYANFKAIGEVLQANFADVGVKLTLTVVQIPQLLADMQGGTVDMWPWETTPVLPDAEFILGKFLSTSEPTPNGNFTRYKNAVVDKLLAAARTATSKAAARSAYRRIQTIVAREAPWIFMYEQSQRQAMSTWVKGYQQPVGGPPSFWSVDVQK